MEEVENDLISRSELLAAYDKAHKGPPGGARELIEKAPEAIVRCKDCKYLNEKFGTGYCDQIDLYPEPDWFCADWERKGND